MTPEGAVKARVDGVLRLASAYKHKPVQNGMGEPALDYHVCCLGFYAVIECKRPGKTFTDRQARIARNVLAAGGSVFLVDEISGAGMDELTGWLNSPRAGFVGIHTAKHLALHLRSRSLDDDLGEER
jgi:hypothetical protein